MKDIFRILCFTIIVSLGLIFSSYKTIAEEKYDSNGYSSTSVGVVIIDNTKIYDDIPNDDYTVDIVATKKINDIVTVLCNCDGYYSMDINGKHGYIKADAIKITSGNPPKQGITLKGNTEMIIGYNEPYNEPGYFAYDRYGHDVSNNVYRLGSVKIYDPDTYNLYYEFVSDWGYNRVCREVTVTDKQVDIDPKKVSRYEQDIDKNEKGKWRKQTFKSSTGLVAVDVWIDGINNNHATIKASYTWLGRGDFSNIYTELPNKLRNYSTSIIYDNIMVDGTYDFVLYENKVPTLKYSIRVDGVSFVYNDQRASADIENDERNFLSNMQNISFSFDPTTMQGLILKIMPNLKRVRLPYCYGIINFAVGLMFNDQHDAIIDLIHGDIIVDERSFIDLSDCEKSFLVSVLYSYEFGEVRIPLSHEQLDELINSYFEKIEK